MGSRPYMLTSVPCKVPIRDGAAQPKRRFTSAAKAVEDSEVCSLPVEEITKILEKDYKAGFYFMKQIAVIVSSRLIKIHYQMDVTGSGYI